MKTVIVFDHPYTIAASHNQPHFRSYSAAIAQHAVDTLTHRGEIVDVIDLHADHFNPVMTATELTNWRTKQVVDTQAENYYQRLVAADQIIFIFPLWWEVTPAMTKGFLDKVLSKRHYQATRPRLLPKKPRIVVLTTAGTPTSLYKWIFGNPVTKMLKRGTFNKLGLYNYHWLNFTPEKQSEASRTKSLAKIDRIIK